MRKIIDNLREKPEHVRKGVALGASAGIVAVIVLVWATTLPARFAARGQAAVAQSNNDGSVLLEDIKDKLGIDKTPKSDAPAEPSGSVGRGTGSVVGEVIVTDPETPAQSPSFTIAPEAR